MSHAGLLEVKTGASRPEPHSGSSAGSENLPGVLTQRSGSNNIKLIYLTISKLSPTPNFGKVL